MGPSKKSLGTVAIVYCSNQIYTEYNNNEILLLILKQFCPHLWASVRE